MTKQNDTKDITKQEIAKQNLLKMLQDPEMLAILKRLKDR